MTIQISEVTMTNELEKIILGDNENIMINHSDIGVPLHPEVITPFLSLKKKYMLEGVNLQCVSGFRSFSRQLEIFNKKASGQTTLFGNNGETLDYISLSNTEKLFAILRWSALPGISRHHWGSEIDVFDLRPLKDSEYKIQLIPDEYDTQNGIFKNLSKLLEIDFRNGQCDLFFRPYSVDLGGVAVEPWHLSYLPLADDFYNTMTIDILKTKIEKSEILLKDEILNNLPHIYDRYFKSIGPF